MRTTERTSLFVVVGHGGALSAAASCSALWAPTRRRPQKYRGRIVLLAKSRSNKAKGAKRPPKASSSARALRRSDPDTEPPTEKSDQTNSDAGSSKVDKPPASMPFAGPIAPYLLRTTGATETREQVSSRDTELASTESLATRAETQETSVKPVARPHERRKGAAGATSSEPPNSNLSVPSDKKATKSSSRKGPNSNKTQARNPSAPKTEESSDERDESVQDPASVLELVRAFRKERQQDKDLNSNDSVVSSSRDMTREKLDTDLKRYRIKDVEETAENTYDPVAAILGKGQPSRRFFGTLLGPYLQNSHLVGLFTVLLCAFGYDAGNPLTNLSDDVRDKLRKGLLIVATINFVMALQAYFEARRRKQSTLFWFLKTMVLGGLALRELEENVPLPRKEIEQPSKNAK
ncbi:hypothetical protein CCYA_CCYA17G4440 [Cyanidiococcus yangmingshanensis]|nr:hypothetical protein CCYA_CCYA17G4440 [Cyanidiococcus yangmingshanensis]